MASAGHGVLRQDVLSAVLVRLRLPAVFSPGLLDRTHVLHEETVCVLVVRPVCSHSRNPPAFADETLFSPAIVSFVGRFLC